MELRFSEEQIMLRDVTRRLCENFCSLANLRAVEGTVPGYSPAFWNGLVESGIAGLAVDTQYGGLGLGALELTVVHEEFGRHLAFSAHFVSSVLAQYLLSFAGSDDQRQRWLSGIAGAGQILSVASVEPGRGHSIRALQCRLIRDGSGYRLSGTKYLVPYASSAQALLVLARDDAERSVAVLVEPNASGLSIQYQPNHAREAQFKLQFSAVHVDNCQLLKEGADISADWDDAMSVSLIALAAQAVGGAARVLELTVEYAKVREAFGKPIGSFQAIAHSLADVAVELEGCRLLVRQAAWAKDGGYAFKRLAAIAKLQACEMFRRASAVAIQVHGGIGYTNDADPQLFFRRAKQLQVLNWDAEVLEERIAALLLQELPDAGLSQHV